MSTATDVRPGHTSVTMFSADSIARELPPKMYFKKYDKGESGPAILVVDDIAVFRSGTFRDSMGMQATYEGLHIDQMVMHFELLRERHLFADVPVRDGHPGFLINGTPGTGKVVGYHTGLRKETRTSLHDGKEYDYLIAQYEIIDPEAQQAIQSGLWRNRSAEIGAFYTNDEAEFWPVYLGMAYVDIPAVQGLAFSQQKDGDSRFIFEEESMTVPNPTPPTPLAPPTPPTPPAPAAEPSSNTAATVEPTVVEETEGDATVTPSADATPAATPPQANHAAPVRPAMFRVNGAEVSDFAAVQAHIDTLEQFRSESIAAGRADFVNGLVRSGKLLASQMDDAVAFAKSLDTKAFESWKAIQEGAPAVPVLGQYGATPQGADAMAAAGATDDRIGILKGIIAGHVFSNVARAQIEEMGSYKELMTLEPTFDLSSLKK